MKTVPPIVVAIILAAAIAAALANNTFRPLTPGEEELLKQEQGCEELLQQGFWLRDPCEDP